MNILITGCAGFIGYHLSKRLINDGHNILGIDNMNNYYDIKLKQNRLKLLQNNKTFKFDQIDLNNSSGLKKAFKSFKPKRVVNLAAQAGVRYSVEYPQKYVDSNILGFINIAQLCVENDVEGLIYASSSSVYGANAKAPFGVDDKINTPKSVYGATKACNELFAHVYYDMYGLNCTGLRFFTVYGSWYRPDMAIFLFTRNIINGNPIVVYNRGNMKRDFTYIDDIIEGTVVAIRKNYDNEIFNLGNNLSHKVSDLITLIEDKLQKKAIIKYEKIQLGDVIETCADISHSKEKLDYEPCVKLSNGLDAFVEWYKGYYNV